MDTAHHSAFGFCAPAANRALLAGGHVFERFRSCLRDPSSFFFVALDDLVVAIHEACDGRSAWHHTWSRGLAARYAGI